MEMVLEVAVEASESKEERLMFFHRTLLTMKYMNRLKEAKAELQQKGLSKEEIKARLEGIQPEAELIALMKPECVNEFIQEMAAKVSERKRT
jgi:hypothetical protein